MRRHLLLKDFQDFLQVENNPQESRNLWCCGEGRKVHVRNVLFQSKVKQMFGKQLLSFFLCVSVWGKFPETWIIFSNKK